jgi:hypothetical protein
MTKLSELKTASQIAAEELADPDMISAAVP